MRALLLLFSIISCSTLPTCYWEDEPTFKKAPNGIPKEFLPYYRVFYKATEVWPYGTTAAFSEGWPSHPQRVGVCYSYFWGAGGPARKSYIEIKKGWWERATSHSREALILHELGHCVLHRRHDDRMLADGTPASIMHTFLIEGHVYGGNKKYYLHELGANK